MQRMCLLSLGADRNVDVFGNAPRLRENPRGSMLKVMKANRSKLSELGQTVRDLRKELRLLRRALERERKLKAQKR